MGVHREFRHIVDVDGMLIGVDPVIVTPASLLARAGVATDRAVMLVVDDVETTIAADVAMTLSETQVVFLRTRPPCAAIEFRRAA
ncbi:MAG: hypothetical protein GY736_08900 [Sphingomonas sp.]|uniref:Uncharacterized protein n=1 Tax=Sphingomonas aquatilis TaxID=93063 RepID=A0AAW3TVP6_9SPHN|nr:MULTISPECIES: hypothetical protein [Sphingomonas]MBB3877012.1 hypothetical protein [Sphingomonas aquatilis]MCP4026409.1 hypothetical protein [Sphingomonas sp.]GEM71948.1 hypothetical protein SAQ01S_17140 [Sphingomonas aquatilis NBRC 16722]